MYHNDPVKVLTGECRLSYCHLSEPRAAQAGADPKYSVTLLLPKQDTATKADIDQSIEAAITEGVTRTWGGQRPAMPKIPLYDGDGARANGEPFGQECKGHWVINASSKDKPQVVHVSNIRAELAPQDIYSGMYGRVTIRFFTYSNAGNRGVGCALGNVMKTREGEALGGGKTQATDDFAGLEQVTPQVAVYPVANQQLNPITGLPL